MRTIPMVALLVMTAAPAVQARQVRTPSPRTRSFTMRSDGGDRAMLGVGTTSGSPRDTLGVLITSITAGSPAERAGLEEGDRIASIDGVNLKVAREDAGESDMAGMMSNRLAREMRKVKPGDEVALQVWSDGHSKTVKVKTVAADELSPMRRMRAAEDDRAALGIGLTSTGSKRDTLGVFISSVTPDGPAEKAGVIEGDRIASINGVDLRTPKEDLGDREMSGARIYRLQREVHRLKPGQSADLVIWSGGHTRPVKVTAGRARDLSRGYGFSYSVDDGNAFPFIFRGAPGEPRPPMPPGTPESRYFLRDDGGPDFQELRGRLQRIGPEIRMELDRELPRAMEQMRRSLQTMGGRTIRV